MADNLVNDVVEQIIDEKPQKSKLIVKWVIRIAGVLITVAFAYGQYRMTSLNKLDSIQKNIQIIQTETQKNTQAISDMRDDFKAQLDGLKDQGYTWFTDYQQYSKNQFNLLIDYGSSNKDMLKRVLEINGQEKSQELKTKIEQSKIQTYKFDPSAFDVSYIISEDSKDTIFKVRNATQEYLKKIPKKYKHISSSSSKYGNGLIDISYQNY